MAKQPVKGTAQPQVCIVELGGTIGDIEGMAFVESFRQFQFKVKVSVSMSMFRLDEGDVLLSNSRCLSFAYRCLVGFL